MGKELSEMTLEELWELFPISLVEHSDKWADDYKEIELLLQNLFAGWPIHRISHIGSTAIAGIWAKNIIDVMIEFPESSRLDDAARILEQNGFTIMSADTSRISLNKGYTPDGFADKVYHVHLRYAGDNNELYFRDYLNEHPDVAKEYEALKLRLWKQFEHNRDAYTDAKTEFITKWTAKARKEYGNRY
ncbi:MAG: GrpB family protein [Clostridia bacterium]